MVKKKTSSKKNKPSSKKTKADELDIETYSISELLEKNKIKPLYAVGFLQYYGLSESFKKEIETKEIDSKFTDDEFDEMYERYIKREI